jgi:hypothetical protein
VRRNGDRHCRFPKIINGTTGGMQEELKWHAVEKDGGNFLKSMVSGTDLK